MDISKLPRLSKTEGQAPGTGEQPAAETPSPDVPPVPTTRLIVYQEPGFGLEMWITLILALLFLALGRQFASYAIATAGHQTYHTGVTWQEGANAGQEVPYPQLDASFGLPYWSDSGLLFFGLALLVSAASLVVATLHLRGRKLFGWIALVVVVASVLYNLFVSVKLVAANITPLLSLVCVGLGGYEAYLQYRAIRGPRAVAMPRGFDMNSEGERR